LKINASRIIKLAALILLAAVVYLAASQYFGKRDKPACAGLDCYDDSDCGSKCHCVRPPESKLGKCVVK
jgi:hypothetical protein